MAYVRLHHEKKTAERLTAMNIENFLPVQEEIRQWTYRKKKIERVVIPMMIFVSCGCGGTFAGAHAVGHQPVYGAAWRTYSGGDSGRANGTVQIYAGLFGRGGGDVCRTIGSGRIDTSGQRSAKGTGRRIGGSGWKGESGGETGFVGMCGG